MTTTSLVGWSRRLSYVLRHDPASAGVTLDAGGWVHLDELLAGLPGLTRDLVTEVVAADDKRRFTLTGDRIRAAQGHTTVVDGIGTAQVPPPVLFHGTVAATVAAIRAEGLRPGRRRDVHLSGDEDTARRVGARRGDPVILRVDAAAAHAAGVVFRVADNGVWLTDHVPARFITG